MRTTKLPRNYKTHSLVFWSIAGVGLVVKAAESSTRPPATTPPVSTVVSDAVPVKTTSTMRKSNTDLLKEKIAAMEGICEIGKTITTEALFIEAVPRIAPLIMQSGMLSFWLMDATDSIERTEEGKALIQRDAALRPQVDETMARLQKYPGAAKVLDDAMRGAVTRAKQGSRGSPGINDQQRYEKGKGVRVRAVPDGA